MTNSLGILIGGLVPALAFGIGALFQKHSNDIGIGHSSYLLHFSAGVVVTSVFAYFLFQDNRMSAQAGLFAVGHGMLFGIGFVCLAIGLTIYQEPISKLVPLANMSTLVAVVLGLLIFSEHTKLNVTFLLSGAVLIVLGGILVSRA